MDLADVKFIGTLAAVFVLFSFLNVLMLAYCGNCLNDIRKLLREARTSQNPKP